MSINLEKLIESTGGNEDRIKLYLETYVEGVNEQLPNLTMAIEKSDYPNIRTIMHSLKPLFTILGFDEIWQKANEIETNVDLNQQIESIKGDASIVLKMLKNSVTEIKENYEIG